MKLLDTSLGPKVVALSEARTQFSQIEIHKIGVKVLAPRHEALHFSRKGLVRNFAEGLETSSLTRDQEEAWLNALEGLIKHLR